MHGKYFLAIAALALGGCAYPRHDDPVYHEVHHGGPLRVVSETTLKGFAFPESVVCDAREDPRIKAVVLRVETGGGSAMAADVIWRQVQLTTRSKPVIVSMGGTVAHRNETLADLIDGVELRLD